MSDTVLEALTLWICSQKKILVGNFSLPGLMLSLASEGRITGFLSFSFTQSFLFLILNLLLRKGMLIPSNFSYPPNPSR